ncbi:hypothetical protein [Hydromonas duriensis]|uniref:Uncharacterized protein n=1 Tax=Hydromonas duriensis TaxID=1527608 RepID=A0A4R6Y9I3_9BURK|nr:hypothetical protein [Hydromonas duriensis]TDR32138.1 hypothetical protein DFR44_10521 [Hydromonas duriensis]
MKFNFNLPKASFMGLLMMGSVAAFASTPESVNVLKFKDGQTLFIGDSQSATLYAYSVPEQTNAAAGKAYNIHDLSSKLASFAGVAANALIIRDMAIHPVSKEAYIAFDTNNGKGYTSHVVVVNQAGELRAFDLAAVAHTEAKINDAPTNTTSFWGKTPMRALTITDIDFYKGKVYISGMSNAEFSSALRVLDYPFNGTTPSTSSVEIFHGVHNQNETRAPIQTMTFVNIDNKDYVLAAYTCTPLVLIPVDELKNGAHVKGKTIGEMGYGNTPVDMIKFKSAGFDKKPYEGVILSNRNRSASFINMSDIASSAKKAGITSNLGFSEKAGVESTSLPMTGLLQLDDQDDYHITALRRDDETGNLELISFMKNVYLRLDEFVSEYDQPSYEYKGEQLQMKGVQNMLIQDLDRPQDIKK